MSWTVALHRALLLFSVEWDKFPPNGSEHRGRSDGGTGPLRLLPKRVPRNRLHRGAVLRARTCGRFPTRPNPSVIFFSSCCCGKPAAGAADAKPVPADPSPPESAGEVSPRPPATGGTGHHFPPVPPCRVGLP